MHAVIRSGGKQYRVAPGQVISVEKLDGAAGSTVQFTSVLLVDRDGELIAGPDRLKGARVLGHVVAQRRARKLTVVKFKRRKNYRRHRGHRQASTAIRITNIEV